MSSKPATEGSPQTWNLDKEMELRFEIPARAQASVRLVSGTAESLGTELARGVRYNLKGDTSTCIFTWHGCVIELDGECHAYTASETPMNFYANVHGYLQKERAKAHASAGEKAGPRLMVGSTDSGKNTLCRILCSYAARMDESPTFVDLDISQGSITIPGMLAAVPIERPVDIEEGFGGAPPIAYFYGNTSPAQNAKLYTQQVQHLAAALTERCQSNPSISASGAIINTCGWVEGVGYNLLLDAIEAFNPTVILVIAHERLYSDLNMKFRGKDAVKIVKTPKSGGVVVRDQQRREKARVAKIHEYFYGPREGLSPHSTVIAFRAVRIFKVGVGRQAPSSALPIGAQSTIDPLESREVAASLELRHSILGVSHVVDVSDGLMKTNLLGFIYISEVDLEKQLFTCLTPCPGRLPGTCLLLGNIKYMES